MNRKDFLKTISGFAIVPFLGPAKKIVPTISESRHDTSSPNFTAHIAEPTISKIRGAVQSLAGRGHRPFDKHLYHGLMNRNALLGVYESADISVDISNCEKRYAFASSVGEVVFAVIPGTGVEFMITDSVVGCFIFSQDSNFKEIKSF